MFVEPSERAMKLVGVEKDPAVFADGLDPFGGDEPRGEFAPENAPEFCLS